MTPNEHRRSFGPYFRCLADKLGLRDWTTCVVAEKSPDDPEAAAEVYCIPGRKRANITLGEWFLNGTADEQRHYAVHELIHCHFRAAQDIGLRGLSGLGRFAWERAHEDGIDAVADIVAPLMPLPSEVKPKPKRKP